MSKIVFLVFCIFLIGSIGLTTACIGNVCINSYFCCASHYCTLSVSPSNRRCMRQGNRFDPCLAPDGCVPPFTCMGLVPEFPSAGTCI